MPLAPQSDDKPTVLNIVKVGNVKAMNFTSGAMRVWGDSPLELL